MTRTDGSFRLNAMSLACAMALPMAVAPQISVGASALEEVIVTARKREETLQDIPLTVSALSAETLERGGVESLLDAGRLVPNMQIYSAGSGNGSGIYLRGIGSSTISAAFDPAVALTIDGVVTSASRLIVAGQLDMRQVEVLKGPQSLYFGKSATAGVVSINTNDPGDELEVMVRAAYSPEHDGTKLEGFVSGPLSDTFGARLAIATREDAELKENLDPRAADDYRGRESTDARLTLTWDPRDNLALKFKGYVSEYEDDGPNWTSNIICPEGSMQQTQFLTSPDNPAGVILPPGFSNCKLDEKVAFPVVGEEYRPDPNYPTADRWNDGVQYVEQETQLYSLQLDWGINDNLDLTSLTAWIDLENDFMETFDYSQGPGSSHAFNKYKSFSQEFRLESSFDGAVNFSAGLYYADTEQEFVTGQNAVNIGFALPDPVTGNRYDWDKNHYTDTETWSAFAAIYVDFTENLTLTAGARYSEDEKEGSIELPYMHSALVASGFLPSGTVITEGLEFEDENWSPEVALNWAVRDDVILFIAYKSGYKAGGFDNSALPSGSLGSGDVSPLLYDSETGDGIEAGIKSDLADGRVRFNATAFYYIYEDLQVQQFDSTIIQFATFNAGEITTQGIEAEFQWATPVEGLLFNGSLAWTDAEFTDEFINAEGDDMDGEKVARSADWTGNLGFTFDRQMGNSNWNIGLSADARYNDGYRLTDTIAAPEQDSFWMYDAALRFYSSDDRWELAAIGRNLGDEVVAYSTQSRPFACGTDPLTGSCVAAGTVGNDQLDQIYTSSLGRQYTIQLTYRY